MNTRVNSQLAALACAAISATSLADTVVVRIYDNDFSLNPVGQPVVDAVINVGDTIRWVWDTEFHTTKSVAGIPESWDSGGPFPVGHEFEHTFTNVGVWHYYCEFHGFDKGNGMAGGMAGTITVEAGCYPDCDTSTGPGVLDIFDFLCFQNSFANSEPYACECDTSTGPGVCDIFDFLCFQNAFATGCP
jgi:plastocyanin